MAPTFLCQMLKVTPVNCGGRIPLLDLLATFAPSLGHVRPQAKHTMVQPHLAGVSAWE
eukprot:m.478621 g.478621  ORF g.478621 m.478621 type:complete len:58 (-) comp47182_c0_seq1:298-471(-)